MLPRYDWHHGCLDLISLSRRSMLIARYNSDPESVTRFDKQKKDLKMLVLTRKEAETIRIGDNIVIKVIHTGRGTVKLGIEAPGNVRVLRAELSEFKSPVAGRVAGVSVSECSVDHTAPQEAADECDSDDHLLASDLEVESLMMCAGCH